MMFDKQSGTKGRCDQISLRSSYRMLSGFGRRAREVARKRGFPNELGPAAVAARAMPS
jgi:hypothetical protein